MKNVEAKKSHLPILAGLSSEVCFALLPLIVLILVKLRLSTTILSSPEWAFGASILFGQSLVKFVSGLARRGQAVKGTVVLATTLLVVVGLVPSLTVLVLNLLSETKPETQPSMVLTTIQLMLFLASALSYLVFGTLGEMWDQA